MAEIRGSNGAFEFDDEGFKIPITEENLVAHSHRNAPEMDCVALEDPRDELWWRWWREDTPEDQFNLMMRVAHTVGTVVLRNYPMEHIIDLFENRSQDDSTSVQESSEYTLTDSEIKYLFDGGFDD